MGVHTCTLFCYKTIELKDTGNDLHIFIVTMCVFILPFGVFCIKISEGD